MIAASRRRRPGVAGADESFRLHLRMARLSNWSKRLMRGSLLALLASVVALFAGLEWLPHLIVCLAGFGLGLALPVPGAQRAALAEIRDAVGLSYETALGLIEQAANTTDAPLLAATGAAPAASGSAAAETSLSDPYGFRSAVIDRARLSVVDVRPQSPPAWWLPALAVALALLLVGLLENPAGAGRLGGAGGPDGGGVSAPAAGAEETGEEPEEEVAAPLEPEAGRAQEPQGAGGQGEEQAADSPAVAPPAEGNDSAAPLSRFLDSLRERPEDQGGADAGQPEAGQAAEPSGAEPEREPGGQPGERGSEPQRTEIGSSPDGQPSEAEAQGDQGEGEGESGGVGEAENSEAGADGQQPGAEDEQGQAGAGEQEAPGEQGEAPVGQAGEQLEEGESGLQGGGADGENSESMEGGGAGEAGGIDQAAGVAEGEESQAEFLQGVLEDGPESPAGTVRLPGDDQVTLPAGRSVSDYQNAAEDAITEGDIPLSYQEIIRRYFQ